MLIQSFDHFNRLANFDRLSGELVEFDRPADTKNLSQHLTGQYGTIGDRTLILYRLGESVFLRVNSSVFELDDRVSIHIERSHGTRIVTISKDGAQLLRWEYEAPTSGIVEDDPTAFVEEEDFDFGLFLANISCDPSRRSRLFSGL